MRNMLTGDNPARAGEDSYGKSEAIMTPPKGIGPEYYGAAEPPVRCGESHLSGLTEPPHFIY